MLYTLGIIAFVLNLKKGHYKFQFNQFGITHMTMILVIAQSQFIVSNIFEGLIWFLMPVLIVVCNDVGCLSVWNILWTHSLDQDIPKKDVGRLHGGICDHSGARIHRQRLSCRIALSDLLHQRRHLVELLELHAMHSESRL